MEHYTGFREISQKEIEDYYAGKIFDDIYINQYLKTDNGALLRVTDDGFKTLKYEIPTIKPRNKEQKMAFDLLEDDSIPIKALMGIAGGGKTYLALTHGIHKLKNHKDIKRIMIIRQPEPVGKDIGYLSGNKDEKLAAWFKPITDNLEGGWQEFERRKANGEFIIDIPAFMQGRSIDNCFIIVDEAQLLTKEQVVMLGTRVGENSQIVFSGDYKQTLVDRYKGNKNGLVQMVEYFKGDKEFGCVTFSKSERSGVAGKFARMGF
ncbi:PhoH family protein [Priestia megaterium]|uniref:PhoH family protein n=1 Tax=Priestia megaterium TaxID=1404 RepID=UPI00211CD00C|nr:PhoH family protein [Priestia megaterium]